MVLLQLGIDLYPSKKEDLFIARLRGREKALEIVECVIWHPGLKDWHPGLKDIPRLHCRPFCKILLKGIASFNRYGGIASFNRYEGIVMEELHPLIVMKEIVNFIMDISSLSYIFHVHFHVALVVQAIEELNKDGP